MTIKPAERFFDQEKSHDECNNDEEDDNEEKNDYDDDLEETEQNCNDDQITTR